MKLFAFLLCFVHVKCLMVETPPKPLTKYWIFRDDCYETFLTPTFDYKQCITFSLSKVVGFTIVFASPLLKLPQIIKIKQNSSVEGISILSTYIAIFSFVNTIADSRRLGVPFSVYGETVIIEV